MISLPAYPLLSTHPKSERHTPPTTSFFSKRTQFVGLAYPPSCYSRNEPTSSCPVTSWTQCGRENGSFSGHPQSPAVRRGGPRLFIHTDCFVRTARVPIYLGCSVSGELEGVVLSTGMNFAVRVESATSDRESTYSFTWVANARNCSSRPLYRSRNSYSSSRVTPSAASIESRQATNAESSLRYVAVATHTRAVRSAFRSSSAARFASYQSCQSV